MKKSQSIAVKTSNTHKQSLNLSGMSVNEDGFKQMILDLINDQQIGSNLQCLTLSGEEFEKMAANDYAGFREISPYASLKESEILEYFKNDTLRSQIEESSYYRKKMPKSANLSKMDRSALLKCHTDCRNFATQSIIDALYPVDELMVPVQHLDCAKQKFYILSRVRTNAEYPTVEETAKKRSYLSFTLASHLNLSHFPGMVWYGYRTGITANMIDLISPYDADTRSWASNRLELGAHLQGCWLDVEDLTKESLSYRTYSQLSIKSNHVSYTGPVVNRTPVTADCVLCIDRVDELSKRASDEQELPILVLHPSHQTLRRIHDLYSTPDYANPKYL